MRKSHRRAGLELIPSAVPSAPAGWRDFLTAGHIAWGHAMATNKFGFHLRPMSGAQLGLVEQWTVTFRRNLRSRPVFSVRLSADLEKLLGCRKSVELVEITCFVHQHWDSESHAEMNASVIALLHERGESMPRGKRTKPDLALLVGDLVPLLLALGVPLASGANSKMVRVLDEVHAGLGMRGDPRNELRRLIRQDRLIRQNTLKAIRGVLERTAAKLRVQAISAD